MYNYFGDYMRKEELTYLLNDLIKDTKQIKTNYNALKIIRLKIIS